MSCLITSSSLTTGSDGHFCFVTPCDVFRPFYSVGAPGLLTETETAETPSALLLFILFFGVLFLSVIVLVLTLQAAYLLAADYLRKVRRGTQCTTSPSAQLQVKSLTTCLPSSSGAFQLPQRGSHGAWGEKGNHCRERHRG